MPGCLNGNLPQPISDETEKVFQDLLKQKVKTAAGVGVALLHAMEERFGPEAREVVRDMARHRAQGATASRPDPGEAEEDLSKFCAELDRACVGSHRWERVTQRPDCIGYHYTRCMWAEVYRELGEPELGFVICAGDEPAVRDYNPDLGFRRTKVLMNGDEVCDHVFCVEK